MQQAKIKPFKTPTQAQKAPAPRPQLRMHPIHKRRMRWLLAVLVVMLALGTVQLVRVRHAIAQNRVEVKKAQGELHKVEAQGAALQVQVKQLQNDEYLAKLVRQKYMVSKSGELIFALPPGTDQIKGD